MTAASKAVGDLAKQAEVRGPIDGCTLVQPVTAIVVNATHPSNAEQSNGPNCAQSHVVSEELCLPVGVVAGNVTLKKVHSEGSTLYVHVPGASGPHCRKIITTVRPLHIRLDQGVQCLSAANLVVVALIKPAAKVATCK